MSPATSTVANYVSANVLQVQLQRARSLEPLLCLNGPCPRPNGLAFDTSGNLFVANLGGPHRDGVQYFRDPHQHTLSTGSASPQGMAFDASGNLYVAYESSGVIEKFSPTGKRIWGPFASGLQQPTDLAF